MSLPVVAIIGAGPIGLEAAVLLRRCGFPVQIFERGRPGEHLRQWGHVRMFSPWSMNVSQWGLNELPAGDRPAADSILTGNEFWKRYLDPLLHSRSLNGVLRDETAVVTIGRQALLKQDEIGNPRRRESRFRLLVRNSAGERLESADVVLDCSGTYGQHRWLGAGGIPCPGETAVLAPFRYTLPDVLGRDRQRFAGRTTLLAGSGYSAATAAVALSELAQAEPRTRVIWLTRRSCNVPIGPIPDDPLIERAALTAAANRLAVQRSGPITWRPGTVVQNLSGRLRGQSFRVEISPVSKPTAIEVWEGIDEVLALVGYRPDHSIYEELQVHQCYATQGPMKLAAGLLGEISSDCLAQTGQGIDALRNPEPDFYILGAKSYGRDSRFLLKVGIEQVATVARELCRAAGVTFPDLVPSSPSAEERDRVRGAE